ncbi:Short transient receptor potential channel 6 [Taenia solium]|eukprot:TsM_000214900 transcript=TsM_000214900 gene=TsM_000214900
MFRLPQGSASTEPLITEGQKISEQSNDPSDKSASWSTHIAPVSGAIKKRGVKWQNKVRKAKTASGGPVDIDNAITPPLQVESLNPSLSQQAIIHKSVVISSQSQQKQQQAGTGANNMTHYSNARPLTGFTYRSTGNNASFSTENANIRSSSDADGTFGDSSQAEVGPVFAAPSSSPSSRLVHTNFAPLKNDNKLIDENTRIYTELINDRIKRSCKKLPKGIGAGILLSTPAARVLLASLSISGGSGGETSGAKSSIEPDTMPSTCKSTRSACRQPKVQLKNDASKVTITLAPLLTEQMGSVAQVGKAKKETVAGLKLASGNGLVFKSQLQDKEYVFLNAAEFGEVEVVRELLDDPTLNVDCVDYMGRNAVLLAMKTENIELIGALVGRLSFYAVEDALLNAISQEKIHIVKLIIDHPQYIRMEKIMAPRGQRAGLISKCIERSQFSADITPLMLAAHTNNHEIIQLLLDRGFKLEMPHDRSCLCLDCESIRAQASHCYFIKSKVQSNSDSLILEMQRLHTYQALTSSAYLALTTCDPVSSAFTLRGELYQLASQEKHLPFHKQLIKLSEHAFIIHATVQSMNFAVSCLDLCRTSDEVHSLLTANDIIPDGDTQYHLATIKHAVQCREKKFVAHSNCQHQLENTFYGNMFCIRDFEGWQRFQFFLIFTPLLPILYITCLFLPNLKVPTPQSLMSRQAIAGKLQVGQLLRCPIIKFIGHMLSYFTFLLLITVATFRLDKDNDEVENPDLWKVRAFQIWSYDFRNSQQVMTKIHILLLFWIVGEHRQLFGECKQVYHYGLQDYFRSYYNIMDWVSVSLYLGAFALRILVDLRVQATQKIFQHQLSYAQALLLNASTVIVDNSAAVFEIKMGTSLQHNYVAYRNYLLSEDTAYWLRGCKHEAFYDDKVARLVKKYMSSARVKQEIRILRSRLWWAPDDPEYVSDCLFALANVLSFARVSYLMPAWELLGPLQISLARMVSDIIRFLTLFSVMLIAFVVGLTNLYWYFAKMIIAIDTKKGAPAATPATVRYASGVPAFQSSTATFHTLFWALFGMSPNNVTMVEEELASVYPGHEHLRVNNAAFMISSLGSVLYGVYNACMIIILLNMLIAMMSKSFDEIQGDRLEEWKFARANLWLVYIEHEGVLPAPLNLLPSRVAITKIIRRIHRALLGCKVERSGGQKLRNNEVEEYLPEGEDLDLKSTYPNTVQMSNRNLNKGNFLGARSSILKRSADLEAHLTRVKCNIMRRYLFQLQKQKEAENKSGDLAMLNIQRQQQQQQEFRATSLSPTAMSKERASVNEYGHSDLLAACAHRENGAEIREPTDASVGESLSSGTAASSGDKRLREAQYTRFLAKSCTRGVSSLLMPPSVRRKLEAVAEVQRHANPNTSSCSQDAEAALQFLLLETTHRPMEVPKLMSFSPRPGQSFDPDSFDSQFTARIERPLKHTHLRELYKVEQEMHDMSDALSSVSFTNSTMSEVDELEALPIENI